MFQKDFIVVIPSYNPDYKLIDTVKELLSKGFEKIIIVDDGSNINTKSIFDFISKNFKIRILIHSKNEGKGAAIKTAYRCIKSDPIDSKGVVTVDGDGQHKISDVITCCDLMEKTSKIVFGSRNFKQRNVPLRSRLGNTLTSKTLKLLRNISINDSQTGLRVFPLKYISEMISIPGNRYEYETNVLLWMKKNGISFIENTIETVYLDSNSSSHFNPIKDSVEIIKCIINYKWFFYS